MTDTPYPWLMPAWQQLLRSLHNDRLPHALLLKGRAGLGKMDFAEQFAALVLCQEHGTAEKACGICKPCDLFSAGNHPDLTTIALEEKSQNIKVAQIRDYLQSAILFSGQSGYKVMLMQDADRMNLSAANSLLKTLEEPTSSTLIMLVTNAPERLLPTIKSRCQVIDFKVPEQSTVLPWLNQQVDSDRSEYLLNQANGAPLLALGLSKSNELSIRDESFNGFIDLLLGRIDVISLSSQWIKQDMPLIALWLISWINDLIKLKSTQDVDSVQFPDNLPMYKQISQKFSLQGLFLKLDALYKFKSYLTTSLNKQMLMESLLLELLQR